MTALTEPAPAPATPVPATTTPQRRVPRAGWMIIGSKEFGDHLLSARFVVLVVVLGMAAAIPLYFAAGMIRDAASTVTDAQAIFIALFWLAPDTGTGGLTLALAAHGASAAGRIRVFEAAPEIRPLGVGINLGPHAVKELSGLGLEDALAAVACQPAPPSGLSGLSSRAVPDHTPRKRLIESRWRERISSSRTPSPSSGARQSTPTLPWWALWCTSRAAWPTSSSG